MWWVQEPIIPIWIRRKCGWENEKHEIFQFVSIFPWAWKSWIIFLLISLSGVCIASWLLWPTWFNLAKSLPSINQFKMMKCKNKRSWRCAFPLSIFLQPPKGWRRGKLRKRDENEKRKPKGNNREQIIRCDVTKWLFKAFKLTLASFCFLSTILYSIRLVWLWNVYWFMRAIVATVITVDCVSCKRATPKTELRSYLDCDRNSFKQLSCILLICKVELSRL